MLRLGGEVLARARQGSLGEVGVEEGTDKVKRKSLEKKNLKSKSPKPSSSDSGAGGLVKVKEKEKKRDGRRGSKEHDGSNEQEGSRSGEASPSDSGVSTTAPDSDASATSEFAVPGQAAR